MASSEREFDVYECQSCGNLRLGQPETNCCNESMAAVDTSGLIDPPERESILGEVFGMSSTERDVCHCVMEAGEATVQEIAGQLDRDRSVITRHLDDLVELGVVEKDSRTLSEGGRINVYSSNSIETVRRKFKLGLYSWLIDAENLVDEVTQEKIEAMAQPQTEMEADDADRSVIRRLLDRYRFR